MTVTFAGYIIAYQTYGKYLSRKIFKLSDSRLPPSVEFRDGVDYVPTRKGIIFGHHYASIAGTGPIVGPAIGIIWGWVPALIWVFVGSIVMGAVHDFGTLVVSMRNQGKSISECTGKYVNRRVRTIFFLIIFLELLVVVAIFGLVIAVIFKMYPQSVFPVWFQIPVALALGYAIYRIRKPGDVFYAVIAVVLLYLAMAYGNKLAFTLEDLRVDLPGISSSFVIPATGLWTLILFAYVFVASVLPVTVLLQPRDYINSWQLFVSMGLMFLGVWFSGIAGKLFIAAPPLNLSPEGAPPMFPFLFITIACGAVSGFHSLVSSGTTAKQLESEKDALAVGYGSMLLEGFLAILVLVSVAGGIAMASKSKEAGIAAWNSHYASWDAAKGLSSKVTAFVDGAANMIDTVGVPRSFAVVLIGVFVASYAGTTLDTATRLQRYIVSEFFHGIKVEFMANKYAATLFAVATAAILAFASGADGMGAMKLWPMFGAVNQLLAALGLLVVTCYLKTLGGRKFLISLIPCVFMLAMTLWAAFHNELNFIRGGNILLAVVNGTTFILAIWMLVETSAVLVISRKNEG